MDLIVTILPVVIKDLPISPRFTPYVCTPLIFLRDNKKDIDLTIVSTCALCSLAAGAAATAGSPAAPATSTAAAEADIQKDDPTATPASPKGRGRRSGGKRRKSP